MPKNVKDSSNCATESCAGERSWDHTEQCSLSAGLPQLGSNDTHGLLASNVHKSQYHHHHDRNAGVENHSCVSNRCVQVQRRLQIANKALHTHTVMANQLYKGFDLKGCWHNLRAPRAHGLQRSTAPCKACLPASLNRVGTHARSKATQLLQECKEIHQNLSLIHISEPTRPY